MALLSLSSVCHAAQACLIGMGFVKEAFYHNVWSHIVALSMMYVLGSMENLQMLGIILGMNTGMILLTSLHYTQICKALGYQFSLREETERRELKDDKEKQGQAN